MNTDLAVDDELEPREANAVIGHLRKLKGKVRIGHVEHHLGGCRRHVVKLYFGALEGEVTCVNIAGVALGTTHSDDVAIVERTGGITATHHRRNAQFTGNNCGVTGATTAIGDDGASTLHHRLPIGIGHVRDQHVTRLD